MPLSIMAVVSRIKVPKDIQVLIPRTCEDVMLSGKGELRLQANQMIFNREIILDYLCWPNVITWFLKGETEGQRQGQSDLLWEGSNPL